MKAWQYIAIGLVIWAAWYFVDQPDGSAGAGTSLGSGFIGAWSQAIAGFENVNPAYNNPGGLIGSGDAGSFTAGDGQKSAIFSSLSAGYAALQNTLNNFVAKYGGESLLDATAIYVLGPNSPQVQSGNYPANVVNEANYVANQLGVDVNESLDELEGNS